MPARWWPAIFDAFALRVGCRRRRWRSTPRSIAHTSAGWSVTWKIQPSVCWSGWPRRFVARSWIFLLPQAAGVSLLSGQGGSREPRVADAFLASTKSGDCHPRRGRRDLRAVAAGNQDWPRQNWSGRSWRAEAGRAPHTNGKARPFTHAKRSIDRLPPERRQQTPWHRVLVPWRHCLACRRSSMPPE
jgi:hypothetical protein